MFGPFNPHHPNIVAERHELGVALLAAGDAGRRRRRARARPTPTAIPTEISPLELAQIRFAYAEALLKAHPADRTEPNRLANSALQLYVHDLPDTDRFRKERIAIESFIAGLDARAAR